MKFIGIDLGTSSVKMILTDEKMNIIKQVSKSYPLDFSEDGKSGGQIQNFAHLTVLQDITK